MRGSSLADIRTSPSTSGNTWSPSPGHDDVNAYELGIDLLLDRLEQLRDAA